MSGKLYVDPEIRKGYLDGCVAVIRRARAADGCLDFALTADPIEPGRINVYERWESDVHLQRFRCTGTGPDRLAEIRVAQVEKYRISSVEAP
ncbi:putative quinol monooxygenase [Planobispora longispora]|uniref:putative quinol monooxygenase n=1 Tax=Planobispora longispora TaxID=28887 RepID=UPI001EF7414E|nr:antibiotic biosynthesis monooxygenase family protein [Planobispora longispora]BFE81607.1 antibiotic biosynthesis monooxygenase [Planobispora longispora]